MGSRERSSISTKAIEQGEAAGEARHDERARPPLGVAADQAEDDEEERAAEGHEAGDVGAAGRELAGFPQPACQHDERGRARQVEEEDPLPAEAVHDRPADDRPGSERGSADRSPDAQRLAPLGAGELLGEQGQRGGEDRGRAESLRSASKVQRERRGSEGARERGGAEDGEPPDEDPPAAEPVSESPAVRRVAARVSA